MLGGEPPSPVDPPAGCRFNPRCWMATDECRTVIPALRLLGGPGGDTRTVACHHAEEAVHVAV
ncbi:oligopeptide/dipeptide ABC transporter ATP-binding protein [Leifsonia poae]|uniref:oligopeptide/dipeptide ABC transporter ATP-binding protein n=1 Tax=Leifsonia poae TaxID=110933 RepID=UPI003D667DD4